MPENFLLIKEPYLNEDILNELLVEDKTYDKRSLLTESDVSVLTIYESTEKDLFVNIYKNFQNKIEENEIYKPIEPVQRPALLHYINQCRMFNIRPLFVVKEVLNLKDDNLDLKCYRPDEINLYLMFQSFLGPPVVPIISLDLSNNPFEYDSCLMISQFIYLSSIKYLNFANCQIGFKGIEILAEGIEVAPNLLELDLSNCNLEDIGGVAIVKALSYNDKLINVNLSRNKLYAETAIELGKMFQANQTLKILNLSKNELYPTLQSKKIFWGLRKNKAITDLDLSYNGLNGMSLCESIALALRFNTSLEKINLENNVFSEEDLLFLIPKLCSSKSLKEIYLGGTFWTPIALQTFLTMDLSNLNVVSFGVNYYVSGNIHNMAEKVRKMNPDLKIIYKDKVLPNPPEEVDLHTMVLKRIKFVAMKPKKQKLKKNMGHFMLKLLDQPEEHMRVYDFIDILNSFNAKLDDDLKNYLRITFTEKVSIGRSQKKRVLTHKMAKMYLKMYPTEPLPPPPVVKKEKKGKKRGEGKKKK